MYVWGQALVLQQHLLTGDGKHSAWMVRQLYLKPVKPATNYCTVVVKSHVKDNVNVIEQCINVLSFVLVQDTAADKNCSILSTEQSHVFHYCNFFSVIYYFNTTKTYHFYTGHYYGFTTVNITQVV